MANNASLSSFLSSFPFEKENEPRRYLARNADNNFYLFIFFFSRNGIESVKMDDKTVYKGGLRERGIKDRYSSITFRGDRSAFIECHAAISKRP